MPSTVRPACAEAMRRTGDLYGEYVMGRFDRAGFAGDYLDSDVVAAEAWAAAFDDADINDALEAAEEVLEPEDDLLSLVARRPSRRNRVSRAS
jgi:hypothetical protein